MRLSANFSGITPTGTADATNLTNGSYGLAIQGGSATMFLKVREVYLGGEATASAPSPMVLARDSTVAAGTASGARVAAMDVLATSPTSPVVGNNFGTTVPQRSATLHLLHLSFNAYGGVTRWRAEDNQEITLYGNAVSVGEVSLSAYTGGSPGQMSGHVLLEEV